MSSLRGFTSLLLLLATAAAAQTVQCPSDPYQDPQNDPCNALRYIPSNALSAVAMTLVLLVAVIHTFFAIRRGGKWMLAMVVGEYTYALGFGFRFGVHDHPDDLTIYIVMYLLIVLSPCCFIAANYVLLGRLAKHLGAGKHVLLPAHRLTRIFVLSDVTTFLIQAAGGVLTTSNSYTTGMMGLHIFLAGLVLQLVSFLFFTVLYVRFLLRIRALEPYIWTRDSDKPWFNDWRALAGALCISCVMILIRCSYRVAEMSQPPHGTLSSSESYFYGLDTLMLFIAIAIYIPFWPGRFIPNAEIPQHYQLDSQLTISANVVAENKV
ncbi:hypothetical protein HYDPIDRAFT_77204 [Hydnomerulius pinastri MD-312]|nr:hypothetical protein HYDPIDRAFT_77204 [Hydnomerulius pinastri MD-312]